MIIDLPLGIDDLDKLFQVSSFLDNRDELTAKFQPEVDKYLARRQYFKPGVQRLAHKNAFKDLIVSLIRTEITNHFPTFTPEEIMLLTEPSFLDMLCEGYFFDENNFITTKEGTNDEH